MPRRIVKDDVLEVAAEVLHNIDEPMHYKTLTEVLLSSGAWEGRGKEPDQILYSAMHNDVKRNGEASSFRFLGEGVFAACSVEFIDLIAITPDRIRDNRKAQDPSHRRPDETQAQADARVARSLEPARCGNCAYLKFEGVYTHRQDRGLCDNYAASGKVGRGVDQEPAAEGCWKRRANGQFAADRLHRLEALGAAADVLAGKNGKKR